MAQRITTSFIKTNRPGAYFDIQVKSTPVGVASSGNIVIVGEAEGGAASQGVDTVNGSVLKDTFFTPDQLDRVEAAYTAGPIVDAFRALSSASGDTDITGSANRIYIAKTNTGVKATATVPTSYGTWADKNYGTNGNKYNHQITQSISESAPEITGTVIAGFGATLSGATFTVRQDGGSESVVTLSATDGDHADMATLLVELAGLLPAGFNASEGTATNSLRLYVSVDAAANSKGYGKTFELIETNVGDLALLGHAEGVTTSAAEPEVQIDIKRSDTGTSELFLAASQIAFNLGYEGTTATVTVTDTTFTTTVTGGAGGNLSLDLTEFFTMSDIATFINSQAGYTASAESTAAQKSPVQLDDVTAIGICSTGSGETPGRVKRAAAAFVDAANQSSVLDFTSISAEGLPDVMANAEFLSGGVKGATKAADVISAINDLETITANFVIPLFSRNFDEDIADGLTDSASTYTIDAVHAGTKNHIIKMSSAKIKKHRLGFLSFQGSYADSKNKAGALAHARTSMTMQNTTQVNSAGQIVSYAPWHTACVAAGMQAAGFYKSITNKFANVINFTDPSGFDSGSPGDIEDAIDAGILFMEKAVVGNKWVVDQTTYGVDTNFVFNSIQAMYAADLVSLDLADSFQTAFVGKSLADVDASTALAFLASKMDAFKKQKLIAASDDAPLGFKNAKVSISGPIMEVSVEIKLATAILFIPISIAISQVQSAA